MKIPGHATDELNTKTDFRPTYPLYAVLREIRVECECLRGWLWRRLAAPQIRFRFTLHTCCTPENQAALKIERAYVGRRDLASRNGVEKGFSTLACNPEIILKIVYASRQLIIRSEFSMDIAVLTLQ